ncbi:sensor domain-containing protein [Thauera sinica]|uniref:EAL domain-containing protein n=1 Tax=Thauera sinica TaxID=2665146 RepID=A0ABW1AY66_9RHOO|nr:GGDEF domain-containing phosphodiesterase [Thauera sp. K11]ATE61196.1 GGDEF domain-containing protein [Thauera sp. K11]
MPRSLPAPWDAPPLHELPDDYRLSALQIHGAGIGTWAWNVQTGEIRIADEWARTVGYTLAELEPATITLWESLAHPDDLAESGRQLKRHWRGKTDRYECECRLRHKDGHWVWVLDRGRLLSRDEGGRPQWMFGAHTDLTRQKAAEAERDQILERFRRLATHLPGSLYQYRLRPDGSSHFPYATDTIELIYGCTPADVADDAAPVFAVIHPDDRDRVRAGIAESAVRLGVRRDRYRVLHPTRGEIWIDGVSTPERLADGSTLWHGFLLDATEAERQRAKLKLTAKVFSSTQEGVMITDPNARILEVNEAFCRLTGYRAEEAIGQRASLLKSGRQGPDFYRALWSDLRLKGRWRGEIWNRRKNGEIYPELLSIDAVLDELGQPENYIGVFRDITEVKQHQYELDRATYYDPLTGLPNRRLASDRLHIAIEHAKRHQELVAICYLDLDRFKQINENHDFGVGDLLLTRFAERLADALRGHDTIGRVGGDEFLLLLTGLRNRHEALELIHRVMELARTPFSLRQDEQIALSASIGVALYPELDLSADELIRYADQALYRAKERGRNCYVVFDREEGFISRVRADLLQAAERALADGEFRLFYQPKLDLRSGRVWSVEALIRWRLPDGRIRPPGEFIEALSGTPLDTRVGDWVIDEALRQQCAWHAQGLRLPVSVNVSADHLLGDDFVPMLRTALQHHAMAEPHLLTLEILETSRISDFARVCRRLEECRELGVLFSLDDFGTGYSSLTYMRQLPVDVLKIDRSFVLTMLDSEADLSIVKGIIGLGRAFGRLVIAEGAETPAHIEQLKALGCDLAQGYGLSRPIPADGVMQWVTDWNRSTA